MSTKRPLVSVALASYNGEKFIIEQMDSILNQDYKNIEIVVCDDGSKDNTMKILRDYQKSYPGIVRVYQNEKNLGFVKNFEKAIALSKGDYIALCDQDDIWEIQKISRLVTNIGNNLLIHSSMTIIDENGNPSEKTAPAYLVNYSLAGETRTLSSMWTDGFCLGCAAMFSKELKKKTLPFPEPTAWHELWLAASAYSEKRIKFLDEKLFRHRLYPTSTSMFLDKTRINKRDLMKVGDRILFNEHLYSLKKLDRADRYFLEGNTRFFIGILFQYAGCKNSFVDIVEPALYTYKNTTYYRPEMVCVADRSTGNLFQALKSALDSREWKDFIADKRKKKFASITYENFSKNLHAILKKRVPSCPEDVMIFYNQRFFGAEINLNPAVVERKAILESMWADYYYQLLVHTLPVIKKVVEEIDLDPLMIKIRAKRAVKKKSLKRAIKKVLKKVIKKTKGLF